MAWQIVSPNYFWGDQKWPEFDVHNLGEIVEVSLRYKWPDSWPTSSGGSYTEHTATRIVTFVEPRKTRASTSEIKVFTLKKVPMYVPSLGKYYVPASAITGEGNSMTMYVHHYSKPLFDYDAVENIAGHGADLVGSIPLAAEFMACLGIYAELLNNAQNQYSDKAEDYNPNFTWWVTPLGTSTTEPPYFNPQNISDWHWKNYLRPKEKQRLTIYDTFGPSGFVGRQLDRRVEETDMSDGYKLREFYKGLTPPNGGQQNGGGTAGV